MSALLGAALTLFIFMIVVSIGTLLPRRRRFWHPYPQFGYGQHQGPDLRDPAQQLHAVMAASFQKQKVLNKGEYRVFKIIEEDIAVFGSGYRVFAQTSFGEILRSPSADAFRSINSKRADVLVVDRGGWPVLVVEYQGAGHYQGAAAARDAVKREALRKAGVQYLEIEQSRTDDQIRTLVREKLGWKANSPAGNNISQVSTVSA